MGVYAEIHLNIEWEENVKTEVKKNFINEINNNEALNNHNEGPTFNFYEIFLSSSRYQNLIYQIEDILKPIIEKYPIIEVTGAYMIEDGNSFYYNKNGDFN